MSHHSLLFHSYRVALPLRLETSLPGIGFDHSSFVLVPMPRRPTWRNVLDETVDENWLQTRALPEDMSLLGFTPLTAIHSRLDRKWSRLTRDCQYLEVVTCMRFGVSSS